MFKKIFIINLLVCLVLSIGVSSAGPPEQTSEKNKPPATPLPKPDLVITSIEFKDIKWDTIGGGEKCWYYKVYFTIKNQGTLSSGPFWLRREVKKGGEYTYLGEKRIEGLAPGETKSINMDTNFFLLGCPDEPAPFYKGIIDALNEVSESNENNNTLEKQWAPPQFKVPVKRR